jgi:hypothetical protein
MLTTDFFTLNKNLEIPMTKWGEKRPMTKIMFYSYSNDLCTLLTDLGD